MSTTTIQNAVTDSTMMVRRSLKHILRYPSMTVPLVIGPIVFLLLFVYVFGGTLGAGLGKSGGRGDYVNYVTPGVLLLAVTSAATATAVAVCTDMTQGIVARFRTMSIFRPALLAGHVVGSMVQTFISVAAVLGVAFAVGFRPSATPLEWLGAAGILALLTLSITWIAVIMGLVSENVEMASNLPMLLMILPFFGSGFVPTDSMPSWLAWIARNQPFTPVMETLRGLMLGHPVGHQALLAVAWCLAIAAAAFWGATALLKREPGR
ncbi:ABC transporter permease [Nocardia sp. NPDC059240]|uniref:ABC transporter permease n=1 Tax=Nocardia sp. NPDC059240 TaxID=3346786 RepID=UPI003693CA9A